MAIWGAAQRVAVAIGPERVRLLSGRRNGRLQVGFEGSEPLPEGVVRGRLAGGAFADPEPVAEALGSLVQQARQQGALRRRPGLVAMIVPDGVVKMAATPLQGSAPGRAEGERMARWALRELLPIEPEQVRVAWSVLEAGGEKNVQAEAESSPSRWLLSVGGDAEVLQQYEDLAAGVGWSVGRLLPWTLAAAGVGEGAAHELLLCEGDGALGCVAEIDGIPRLHRAWRDDHTGLARELAALSRYAVDHLEASIGRVRLCGSEAWQQQAIEAAAPLQVPTETIRPQAVLSGVLQR